MATVFVSYSHKDEEWRRELETHLPTRVAEVIACLHGGVRIGGLRIDRKNPGCGVICESDTA